MKGYLIDVEAFKGLLKLTGKPSTEISKECGKSRAYIAVMGFRSGRISTDVADKLYQNYGIRKDDYVLGTWDSEVSKVNTIRKNKENNGSHSCKKTRPAKTVEYTLSNKTAERIAAEVSRNMKLTLEKEMGMFRRDCKPPTYIFHGGTEYIKGIADAIHFIKEHPEFLEATAGLSDMESIGVYYQMKAEE